MARASIQSVLRGDIIVERVAGKRRMTPVKTIEFNACSSHGVHINRSMCYDSSAVVELVDGQGTLGDLEKEIENFEIRSTETTFDPQELEKAYEGSIDAWADKIVKV